MKYILTMWLAAIILSCAIKNNTNSKVQIYWVNSYKVSCTGVAPMQCLQIQKNETIKNGEWQYFYSSIEGFEFEPGYIYKIRVEEEELDAINLPADVSSIKYSLIEVMEKKQDMILQINDIWVLETINGKNINGKNKKIAQIEIHLTEMTIIGNDGCNSINGQIRSINQTSIKFGPIASTRMMCADMTVPDAFSIAMVKLIITEYKT